MHIRWGNTVTSSFLVSNGVKQGGIISPILFNVYMDQVCKNFNASNIGGDIGGKLVNHLCYADDICLISLSSVGMQQLLSICDIYAKEHDLLYNGGKSYSLYFKPKCYTFNRPTFTLNHLSFIHSPEHPVGQIEIYWFIRQHIDLVPLLSLGQNQYCTDQ